MTTGSLRPGEVTWRHSRFVNTIDCGPPVKDAAASHLGFAWASLGLDAPGSGS